MATYYVSEAGTNGAGTSWAAAKTTLAGAIALATASGDVILVDKDHTGDKALASNTTWTVLNNISIVCVDKDASDVLATMGTATWLGSSTASISLIITGAYRVRVHGLTLRNGGTTNQPIVFADAAGSHFHLTSCYLWLGTTSTIAQIFFGSSTSVNHYCTAYDLTVRFGNVSQSLCLFTGSVIHRGVVSSAGSSPTSLLKATRGGIVKLIDCDLSHCGANKIVGTHSTGMPCYYELYRCKLGTNYVVLDTQSPANKGAASVLLLDCSSGDTHGIMHYADALGSVLSDTGIYFTSGAAGQSWKIVTTSSCSALTPFVTPWVSVYNTSISSITPYFEILRDSSATAYKDDEVSAEFAVKVTSGSVQGTLYSDTATLLAAGADQAAGAGLGSWTGENATAWSGKADSGTSLTPAENGEIIGRLVVGKASSTVYVNPQILW